MPRPVARTRLLLLLLLLLNGVWMYAAGGQLAFFIRFRGDRAIGRACLYALFATALLLIVLRAFQFARLPDVARNAHFTLPRLAGVLELASIAAGLAGAEFGFGVGYGYHYLFAEHVFGAAWLTLEGAVFFLLACVLIPALVTLCARGVAGPVPDAKTTFFAFDLRHVSNRAALKYMMAAICLLGLALATLWFAMPNRLLWRIADEHVHLPHPFSWFELGLLVGLAVAIIQGHWHRAIGFVPWAFLFLAVAISGMLLAPGAAWPLFLLGLAGVGQVPLLVGLLAVVPLRQRFLTLLFCQIAVAAFAAVAGVLAYQVTSREHGDFYSLAILLVATLLALVVFTRLLFREFVEKINELVFRVLWMPKAYGPGAHGLPTRGPAVVIGNHGAMFDPVWLQAVIPLRLRGLMLSDFLDKPFLKWLCGRVYEAIRVPAQRIRRTAPEIDEAVAALKRGESVMIFPEAWLRRKEEQPLRRFANGVFLILSQVPETPVITCWIEDGWGSWTSWKGGPPRKNKKMDILKRFRIGINEPEVLPPKLLEDDIATRRYLMERVLHARTHLGLPAHPMPAFGKDEEKE